MRILKTLLIISIQNVLIELRLLINSLNITTWIT